jgi:hypothetical protein
MSWAYISCRAERLPGDCDGQHPSLPLLSFSLMVMHLAFLCDNQFNDSTCSLNRLWMQACTFLQGAAGAGQSAEAQPRTVLVAAVSRPNHQCFVGSLGGIDSTASTCCCCIVG